MSSCAERERVETFHQAFDEDLFRDTVTRERRRADRSGLAMAMLLVGVQDIGVVTEEEIGDARDQAFAVGAGNQQDGGVFISHYRYRKLPKN